MRGLSRSLAILWVGIGLTACAALKSSDQSGVREDEPSTLPTRPASPDRDRDDDADRRAVPSIPANDGGSHSELPDATPDAAEFDSGVGGPNRGPGPHGALPSGYCCTDDAECRYRHCVDVGGSKMCLDECRSSGMCTRSDLAFACDAPNVFTRGLCRPPPSQACIPAEQFVRGPRGVGGCCAATGDGRAGEECEANRCIAIGEGPFFCTQICQTSNDCPSGFVCFQLETRSECIPANTTYSCQ